MTAIALQKQLIKKITKISSPQKLQHLKEILNQEGALDENGALILTSEIKSLIKISQEQIKNGQFKSHEQLMNETNLWLTEKS